MPCRRQALAPRLGSTPQTWGLNSRVDREGAWGSARAAVAPHPAPPVCWAARDGVPPAVAGGAPRPELPTRPLAGESFFLSTRTVGRDAGRLAAAVHLQRPSLGGACQPGLFFPPFPSHGGRPPPTPARLRLRCHPCLLSYRGHPVPPQCRPPTGGSGRCPTEFEPMTGAAMCRQPMRYSSTLVLCLPS